MGDELRREAMKKQAMKPPTAPRRRGRTPMRAAPLPENKQLRGDEDEVQQGASDGSDLYTPLPWDAFYTKRTVITVAADEESTQEPDRFIVYQAGPEGKDVPTLLCIHGGGHTALSFAQFAKLMAPDHHVVAIDLRGHGASETSEPGDLSIDRMVQDCVAVLQTMYPSGCKRLVVIGHSMGGAVAAHLVADKSADELHRFKGLVILDVVEGTALDALVHMHGVIENRPKAFKSQEAAVEWAVKSGMLNSLASARVSIPPQLRLRDAKDPAGGYEWITDLKSSYPYWQGWYKGLSKIFLSVSAMKLLILAGTDRLDKDLMIGQMQGKFQLKVLPDTGHMVQEDAPGATAGAVRDFVQRFGF